MDTNDKKPDVVSGAELSEKYIRTFAGDMETLKKGGVPDLVPLTPPPATEISPQIPIPAPISIPQAPIARTPEAPKTSPIETYANDFSQRMKETRASTATVLAAEQDAGPRVPQPLVPEKKFHWNSRIVIGITLLLFGGMGIYIAYTRYLTTVSPIILAPTVSAPIFVDDREKISGTGPVLLQAIEQSVSRPLSVGSVRLLFMANTIDTDSVFSALHVSAPDILLRNVNAMDSMAGIVNTGSANAAAAGSNQSPFFILSVISYSNTFSGMLSWEPLILRNLETLFPAYPEEISTSPIAPASGLLQGSTTTLATTTPKTTVRLPRPAPASVPTFVDEVVANHDVRVYRDAAGRSILLYGYWNQTTLILARDAAAFTEIVQRLATSRTL